MSSSELAARRRALALGAVLLLAGCNLHPLHGGSQGAELNSELAAIEVERPKSELEQTLRNYLLDELNPAGVSVPARYKLDLQLDRARNALAIQLDDVATRYDLSLAATFELKDKASGKTLYRSAIRRVVSYNVRSEPFATLVAENDADRRAARELSLQIRTQLALYFATTGR